MSSVFVATKPLQLINCFNISTSQKKILLIIDSFYGAKDIAKKKNLLTYFNNVYFFENEEKAYEWIIKNKIVINELYIDSDINKKKILYKLRNIKVYVYEEGVGTYKDIEYIPNRKIIGGLYLKILKLLGYNNRRGGDRHVDGLIVYQKEFYLKKIKTNKTIKSFKNSFLENIETINKSHLFKEPLNFRNFLNSKVFLSVGDWERHHPKELSSDLLKKYDFSILKPHPHIKDDISSALFDHVVTNDYPLELLIYNLLKYVDELHVNSFYSTGVIYFENHKKIKHTKNLIQNKSYMDLYEQLSDVIDNEK